MKVGDYVRTPLGITKYLGKYNMVGNLDDWYEFDKLDENLWFGDIADVINENQLNEVVLKSSPNIIDLIEENDYIRLQDRGDTYYQVVEVPWSRGRNILAIEDRGWDELEEIYDKEEIISVITHEQMKSMEYEVK